MFEKYSHEKKFTYDNKDNEFIELKNYAKEHGNEFVVRGVFTYEGKKGTRPCVITDGFNINLPGFFLDDVNSILSTPEECEAINNGKCGFTITTYVDNKYGNGTCYSGKFHEIK